MAISIEILNGINQAVDKYAAQSDAGSVGDGQTLAQLLERIHDAIMICLNRYKESGEIPPEALARFLAACEEIAALLGGTLDKTTRVNIRSVLAQARLFDENLEQSLSQYKQKLLKALVLGNPLKTFLLSGLAVKKVADASQQLSNTSQRLQTLES